MLNLILRPSWLESSTQNSLKWLNKVRERWGGTRCHKLSRVVCPRASLILTTAKPLASFKPKSTSISGLHLQLLALKYSLSVVASNFQGNEGVLCFSGQIGTKGGGDWPRTPTTCLIMCCHSSKSSHQDWKVTATTVTV